jgi:hypothetical protein
VIGVAYKRLVCNPGHHLRCSLAFLGLQQLYKVKNSKALDVLRLGYESLYSVNNCNTLMGFLIVFNNGRKIDVSNKPFMQDTCPFAQRCTD